MAKSTNVFLAGIEELEKSWGWFLVLGILLMALGVACVATARTATTVSILVLGWVLIISAAVWLANAFQAWSWSGFFVYLLNAIIRGVTGYLLVTHPNAGAEGITMLIASLFIVGGVFRTAGASFIQFPRWGWTAVAGLISVILGVYLLANWSTVSTFFIGLAIGIDLIFDGSALVGFAGAIHSLFKSEARTA
jgi:uncharacterized membrane protein HdeD (DUF308 family)